LSDCAKPEGQPVPPNVSKGQFEVGSGSTKFRLFTLYGLANGWTTKSKFHLAITPILKISTRKERFKRSQQKKMIKLLTLKRNPLCPKPHFLNVFGPTER